MRFMNTLITNITEIAKQQNETRKFVITIYKNCKYNCFNSINRFQLSSYEKHKICLPFETDLRYFT